MKALRFALIASLAFATVGYGAEIVWDGDQDNDWEAGNNWVGNSMPGGSDIGVFDATSGTPGTILKGASDNDGVRFKTGGWTVDHSTGGEWRINGGVLDSQVGVNTITGTDQLRIQSNSTSTIDAGSTLVISGPLYLNRRLHKGGEGTLVLAGTGAGGNRGVSVTSGTLLYNYTTNSIGQAGADGVQATGNGTLGGNGTIRVKADGSSGADVRLLDTSVLAPGGDGTHGAVIGTLTISFDGTGTANNSQKKVDLNNGTTLAIDLGTSAGVNDLLDINLVGTAVAAANEGWLDLRDNQTLALSTTGALAAGDYTIVTHDNPENASYGTFNTVTLDGLDITADLGGGTYDLTYNQNSIVFTVVPEPASFALLGMGGLWMMRRRR